MNKIFRVIWSAATGNWVVVSEISKAAISKPGSVYASEKQLNNVLASVASGSGRLKLTELAIAFCLAGLWTVASPALAAALKASFNPGTEVASSRCGTGANATNVAGIAVGCGAQAVSGIVSVLDRGNPFENRNDLRFSTSNGGLLETQSIAIGEASYAGKSAIALGGRSNATDDFATAMGVWARAQGKSSVAIGPRTLATGNTSLALGRESVANADFAQAIGNVSAATGTSSLAIGHSATATGSRSIAIGGADPGSEVVGGQRGVTYQAQSLTKAEGSGSIALGGGARATADRAVALGERAQATRADAVALGSASNTNAAATAINNATVGGHAYTEFAGVVSNPNRVLSVGAAGAERQIKNVGSGEISATSTDAVNGSQLYAIASRQGGGMNFSGDANTNGSTVENDRRVEIPSSGNLNITGGVTNPANLLNDQIGVVADPAGKTLNVRLRKDLNLGSDGSLNFGTSGPNLSNIGLNMNNKKITGLSPGTAGTDAVNVSQLNGVKATADNAMTEVSKGWNLQANGDAASKVAPGNTVQFIDGANIDITRQGNNVTIATSSNLTADSLRINNQGPVLNATGIAMGGKKITGLADGTAPNDAVNFSQLDGVKSRADNALIQAGNALIQAHDAFTEASKGWNLQANGDAASKVAPGNTVQFIDGANIDITRQGSNVTVATSPALTADSLTINNRGPVLNANGIAMGSKKITGLADGAAPNDAVNFSQLDGVKSSADNALTQAGNAIVEASKGWNLQANGDTATKVAPGDTVQFIDGNNINVTRNGKDLTIATASNMTADSLTINNGGPIINAGGINMGGKKITGLADGTAPTDAVSFSQLNGVKAVADNAMAEASKGFNLQTNGDTAAKVAPGDTVQFINGTNIGITRAGNDITIATAADLTADSLTINNGGPVLNAGGIDMGGKKITGLADGTGPTDAVSFSQLDGVKTVADNAMAEASKGFNLQTNGDTATKVAPGDTVQFIDGNNINVIRNGNDLTIATSSDLTADSLTINNGGPVLNAGGIDMGGKKITGLADGTAPTDAVSFSQLDGVKTVADNAMAEASKGFNLQANGDTATKVAPGDTVQFIDGANIDITRAGNNITIATAADLTADSLTINNGGPALNADGIVMGGKKVTGLADGAAPNDAVNFSQLDGVKSRADDALTQAGNALTEASKGWNLQANGDTATKVAPGDTVQFIDGTNIDITRVGNDITISTAADLTADSLTINNGGPVLDADGINMNDKKLINVAPGTLSADSKDAVNASQLFAVGNSTAAALGGNSTFNPDTGVVTPSLQVGDKNFTNVNDALGDLNTTLAATTAEASKGWNLQANGDTPSKVAPGDTVQFIEGANINIARSGNDLTIATSAALTADSLTFNNGGPVLNAGGIDMGSTKITGLADGTAPTDAVSFSQLDGVKTMADNAMVEASKGFSLQANGDTATKVAPGDTVRFIDGTNIDITRAGNDITIATSSALTADSLSIDNGGPIIHVDGINMNDKKFINVAAGTLSADSKDGVNASQLFAAGNSTAAALGGNSTFNPDTGVVMPSLQVGDKSFTNVNDALVDLSTTLADTVAEASKGWNLQANGDTATKVAPGDTVQFIDGTNINITRAGNGITIATAADLTADSLTINNGGPVLNAGGIDLGGKKISGLADGAAPNDAVNFSQLDGVKSKADNALNQADNALAEASRGWDLQANGDAATKVAPGDTVQFIDGNNINVTRSGNDLTIATTADLTADSLIINNAGPVLSSAGIDMNGKKLTNVAPGSLSADSKDAVNASQLFSVGNSTAAALGGNSTFNPDTGVVNPSLQIGDRNFSNVNDALDDLNTALTATAVEASKGWNLQANGEGASKVAPGGTVQFIDGTNIEITRAGNDITIATAADLTADSLTINNGGPALNAGGIDMGGKKITGLADGTAPTDAVSFSQLDGVKTVADNAMAEATKGFNLQANGDMATKVALGDTVRFIDGSNINVIRNGNDLTIATASNLTADSLTINNAGPVLSNAGIDMNDKKLINVAPGTLSADSKDGVNASQLFAVGNSTAAALGGNSTFNPDTGVVTPSLQVADKNFTNVNDALGDLNTTLAAATVEASKGWNLQANGDTATKVAPGDTVQFIDGTNINITRSGNNLTIATSADLTADSLTINNGGPALNADGIVMGGKKITGLADGTAPTDAVSFSQLDGVKTVADNAMAEASKGWNLQANGDTATKVAPGDKVQFIDGTNIDITRAGNEITVATSADLTGDSLTINNGGPVLNVDGINMNDKKLTNVAAGTLSTDSKDGVNASQLFAVGNSTAAAFGGNSTFNPDTGVVNPSLQVGDKNFSNVNDALGDLNTTLAAATVEASKGWNLEANGDTATKVAPGDTVQFIDGANIDITRNGNDLMFATSADLTADSLTINNGGPVLNVDGINMNDKKLTNVAAGTLSTDSKDAVNASQLFAVGNSTAAAFGGNSTFDPDTGMVTPSLTVGDRNFTTVNDALDDLNTTLAATTVEASKGWNLQANGDTASKVAPGDTVQFIDGTNIDITRAGNDITIATSADLTVDSLAINNGGPVFNVDGINMNDKKITNVVAGTLSADSKDAVNASQLFAVGNSTAEALGGNSAFNPNTGVLTPSLQVGDKNFTNVNDALGDLNTTLAATTAEASKGWNLQANGDAASKVAPGGTVQFIDGTNIDITRNGNDLTFSTSADLTAESLTINNGGPVFNVDGINMNDKKLTNVAAGTLSTDSKDGVNASQLFAVGNSTAAAFGGNSTFDPASGIVTPSLTVGDKNFSNVNDALGDLNTTLAATTTEASKGWNLQANGDTATKVAPGDTVQFIDGTNIDIIRNGNEITIATVADLTADSLTFNNGGPVLSSTGIDLSDKKLTNVAAGTLSADSKDGVNASQLFAAGSSTAAAFGGDSTFDPETGEVKAGLKIGDKLFTSVNSALDAINNNVGTVARRSWDIAGADGIVANVATGGQVRFVAGNEYTKVGVTQDNGVSTVSVSAASSPLQYTQANQANGKNDPIADPFIKTNSVTLVGQDTTAPVSLNNVARATLSADSVQAVNGQQLYGLGQSIASTLGGETRFNAETGQLDTTIRIGNNSYRNVADALSSIGEAADRGWQLQLNNDTPQNVAAGSTVGFNQGSNMQLTRDGNQITVATVPNVTFESVKTDRVEGDTISAKSYLGVIDGPALTQSGIDAAGKPITNLKPGEIAEGSTDAVTGGQLHSLAGGTAAALNRLQGNLDRVAKDANAGSATAGAMANLPQAYLPGKSMFALATARYVGQQGFAAGLSKVSENGNWIIKGSVSGNTRGKTMVGAGIGYQW